VSAPGRAGPLPPDAARSPRPGRCHAPTPRSRLRRAAARVSARAAGGQHLPPQAVRLASGVVAPVLPGVDERCAQCAYDGAIPPAPRDGTDIVPDLHFDCVLRLGFDNPVLPPQGNGGFHGGQEPGPDIDPSRAQDQGRRQAAPVRNAPCRHDRQGLTASTTCGRRVNVAIVPRNHLLRRPWAMMTSTPRSAASRACCTVVT